MQPLPIVEIIDEFVHGVSTTNRIILSAPTGVGKSTQIPQTLLDRCGLHGQILVLQPRRIAARMLCARVSQERLTRVGSEVGYQTRLDTRSSKQTRILFITAGILPRYFLSNRRLSGIDAVVLDEFHERSIHNDLALGLLKNLQETERCDLKLVVMSATLDVAALHGYLSSSIHIQCKNRGFPVEILYGASMSADGKTNQFRGPVSPQSRRASGGSSELAKKSKPVWEQAAEALRTLVQVGETGDVLIFMPGVYEIQKTISSCKQIKFNETIRYFPLYGDLPPEHQEDVMLQNSCRKVIVATNIAETSLTIPGVHYVIDSGLVRENRYDPHRGLNTLFVEPTSKDSADQRAGRAGREAPGKCIRLWSRQAHSRRNERTDPEIRRIDLAEVVLQLKNQGFHDLYQFPWLDPPAQNLVDQAIALLVRLGALDRHNSTLTQLGKRMARIPAHPRVARLLIEAEERHCGAIGALLAAVVSERSIILRDKESKNSFVSHFSASLDINLLKRLRNSITAGKKRSDSAIEMNKDLTRHSASRSPVGDLFSILDALVFAREHAFDRRSCQAVGIHGAASKQVWKTFDYFSKFIPDLHSISEYADVNAEDASKCLLVAYSDRLAKQKNIGSLIYLLNDGRRAELARHSSAKECDLIIAIDLVDLGAAHTKIPAIISLACEVRRSWLDELFPTNLRVTDTHSWNDTKLMVERYKSTYFDNLIIEEVKNGKVDPEVAATQLAAAIKERKLPLNGWDKDVKNWLQRVECVVRWFPHKGLKHYDDNVVEKILVSLCKGSRRYADVKKKPCIWHVKNQLTHQEQQFVDAVAPARIILPSGRRMRIKYSPGKQPKGNAKIQDLFGLMETPRVAQGQQRILIEILAPNFRPIQVTDDLKGFWRDLYPRVKKELSRRYPSQEWR